MWRTAALVGLATPNADGSIQVGLNIVTAPSGRGVQMAARFTLPSASGTWSDSAGNSGPFAFGASTGGSPRPLPTIYDGIAIGVDGLPVVSYRDLTVGGLGFTHCGTATCTAGNVSTVVDAGGSRGYFTAVAIGTDGLPVISHQDVTTGALRVTHCGTASCSAGNVSTTVDDPVNSVGRHSSIAVGTDGLPVISYQDQTAGALRVIECGTRTCQ